MKYASSVVWAVMENHGYNDVRNLSSHQRLLQNGVVFDNYYAVSHPSGPNYRTLACGKTIVPTEEYAQPAVSVSTVIEHQTLIVHLTTEDIAARHNPYQDTKSDKITQIHFYTETINRDEFNHTYFGWDDANNAHSGPLDVADKNLNDLLDNLDKSTWFNTPTVNGLYPVFMFVWDEELNATENHVFAAMYGKSVKARGLNHNQHNHYDFNRTITDIYEVTPLVQANPMIDVFS